MATIDDRVVSMAWENTRFINGISSSLNSLDKLNAALKRVGIDNGLDNIEKSANKITFGGLGSAIDRLKAKFGRGLPEATTAFSDLEKSSNKITFGPLTSAIDRLKGKFTFNREADQAFAAIERSSGRVSFTGLTSALANLGRQFSILEGAASVALGNIAAKAVAASGQLAKSLTVEPLTGGFKEYETQLNAVQTILSNTQASGAGLKDVNKALLELNHYADQTIYNFTEMTRNIGTFTAAGVDLKTATGSIKGIANLAALSGSNSQQASTAMYQLSQAISAGRVSLQDWNSVVNAGMGGTVFQRALAQTAVAMGEIDESALKLTGKMKNVTINGQSFRESVMAKPGEESWLTGDVLTNTLQQLSGDLSEAELKAQGFSAAQIKAIQAQAKMAVNAATQVKTLSGLLDTTKEAVGSGWAQTWQILFGDFGEAKTLFTGLSEAIGGFVGASSKARNSLLQDWKELGGRKVLLDGLKAAFEAVTSVINPIREAWRDIFPQKTAQDLLGMTVAFRNFMRELKLGPETMDNLKSTFKGLFAILSIGKQILGGVIAGIGRMFGAAEEGSGGILALTGDLGDLIAALDAWLKDGDKIKKVFAGLGDALSLPIKLVGDLTGKLGGLFSGNVGGGVASALSAMGEALRPASQAADAAKSAWGGFLKIVEQVGQALDPVVDAVGEAFGSISDAIGSALENSDWDRVFSVIQTGLVAGIFLTIKKAIGGFKIDFGGGVLENVSESLGVLQGSLVGLQRNIQARTLLLIATAVGVLTASVVALSLVSAEKLASSLTAISVGMGQLMAAMAILGRVSGSIGMIQAPVIAASLILLAAALAALSVSVLMLSRLSWDELARGLTGLVGLLGAVSIAVIPLSKAGPGMILAGAGLIAIGAALTILGGAVKIFATMSWEEIGKGIGAIAASLVAIGLAMNLMPPTLALTGAGLVLVSIGLAAIAGSVAIFGSMDLRTLAKGVGALAASLAAIGLAMSLMPPTLPLTAAGLILVGIALTGISGAIALLGNLSLGTLTKGIAGLAGSLTVLAVGLTAMIAALPGAAALLVASAALAIFVPVLGMMGSMGWGTIGKGLAAIALSLLTLGAAGLVAAPALLALGVALGVFGIGLGAVGAAVYLLAKGISILAGSGAKGFAVFVASLTAMIAVIPKVIISFIRGLVEIVAEIAKLAPLIVNSLVKIINSLVEVVIRTSPRMALAATALITAFLSVLSKNAGPMIEAGWKLLLQLLSGISSNIGRVATTVGTIIARFLSSISSKMPSIVTAGANIIVRFLEGISNNVGRVVRSAATVVVKYIDAIGNNLGRVVTAGANLIVRLIAGITNNMGRIVTAGSGLVIRLIAGITSNIERVVAAGVNLVVRLINAISRESLRLVDEGAKAILRFMRGIADAIRKYEPELIVAGADIGKAIVEGMINGLAQMAPNALKKAVGLGQDVIKAIKRSVKSNSPSKEAEKIGGFVVMGLANGLDANSSAVNAATTLGTDVLTAFRDLFVIRSPSEVMYQIGKYVGEGFAQGLLGTREEVQSAYADLTSKIQDEIHSTETAIAEHRSRLTELRKVKKEDRDWDSIREVKKALAEDQKLLALLKVGNATLVTDLRSQKNELAGLAGEYERLATKLKDAETALENATQARDNAASTFRNQYSALPDFDPEAPDQLGSYLAALGNQTNAVAIYKDTLNQLRALGLDDMTYQKLLDEGTAAQGFANQLLAAGPNAVAAINAMDQGLMAQATTLAQNAATGLYQAGVDAAAGLIRGLNEKQSEVRKAMEKIATEMIKAIKKKLKIKSPSREFEEVGKFSSLGVAKGLQASTKAVSDAASGVGENALVALRDSVAHISDAVMSDIDTNPKITPILDLSQIHRDAKQLDKMTNVVPISAAASYGLAALVDMTQRGQDDLGGIGGLTLKFEQNNTSPKALSAAEIYRQTNNQLSQAKAILGVK